MKSTMMKRASKRHAFAFFTLMLFLAVHPLGHAQEFEKSGNSAHFTVWSAPAHVLNRSRLAKSGE